MPALMSLSNEGDNMNAAISNHFPKHSTCTRCKAECIRYSPYEERLDVRLGLFHTPERCEAQHLTKVSA